MFPILPTCQIKGNDFVVLLSDQWYLSTMADICPVLTNPTKNKEKLFFKVQEIKRKCKECVLRSYTDISTFDLLPVSFAL